MTTLITDEQARDILRAHCRERGAAEALAERAGVSPCSISLMLSGQRRIGPKLATVLGLRSVRGYVANRSLNPTYPQDNAQVYPLESVQPTVDSVDTG